MSKVLAITGGIACGKSSVTHRLAELLGDPEKDIFDCDEAVSKLLTERKIVERLRSVAGDAIVSKDGGLNRGALREAVFRDPGVRKKVEEILHPAVLELALSFLKSRDDRDFLFLETPLLYEVEFPAPRDWDIAVGCSRSAQFRRLEERGIEADLAERIMETQLPIEEKIERADFVIWNDGSMDALDDQTRRLADHIAANAS